MGSLHLILLEWMCNTIFLAIAFIDDKDVEIVDERPSRMS